MRHRSNYNRLGRKASHRKALHNNMVTSLVLDERIKTTKPKAREIKKTVEKMITRAKADNVHNRRIIRKRIGNSYALDKMFTDIAPRFKERPGGYTRMIKLGRRYGDAGEIVILEFVERPEISRGKKNKEKEAAEKS